MKKLMMGIITLCCLNTSLSATDISTKFSVGYFYPTDQRFRDIYSDAILYSLETNFLFCCGLAPWVSLGYLDTSGRSIGLKNKTHLYAIPLNLGLKYFFLCGCIQPYLGLGISGNYSHIHNDSPFVTRNQSGWGVGGIAKSGCLWNFTNCFFLDIFLDYTYLKMHYHHSDKIVIKRQGDLSGLSVGGGIGYHF